MKMYQRKETSEFYNVPKMKEFIKYVESLSTFKPLDKETKFDLIKKIQDGDEEAKVKLQKQYGHFVTHLVEKYVYNYPELTNDLIGFGYVGLIEAAKKFKFNSSFEFAAKSYIQMIVVHEINKDYNRSYKKFTCDKEVSKFQDNYFKKNGFLPTVDEVYENFPKYSKNMINNILLSRRKVSVEGERIIQENNLDEILHKEDMIKLYNEFQEDLKDQDKLIIAKTFGFGCKEHNNREIGELIGVSREAVRWRKERVLNVAKNYILNGIKKLNKKEWNKKYKK